MTPTSYYKVKQFLLDVIKKYSISLVVFAIWLYVYCFVIHWSTAGDGTIWSVAFLAKRCKLIFGLNFNWAILVVAIAYCIHKVFVNKYLNGLLIPLIITYIGLLLFLIVLPTHNHARYLGILIIPAYILCSAGLCSIERKVLGYALQSVFAILILASSFKTIDPVTRAIFDNLDVGSDIMITTDERFSDSIIYNFQYEGYQKALNKAIGDIINDNENAKIFLPALGDNVWGYDAIGNFGFIEGTTTLTEFWDANRCVRYFVQKNGLQPLNITFITDDLGNYSLLNKGETGHLLYLTYVGTNEADSVRKKYAIISDNTYQRSGWIINDLVFANK